MSNCNWIHLSDLHFGYENNTVLNFRNTLPEYIAGLSRKSKYELLFISGDTIYGKIDSGLKGKEYSKAKDFILKIAVCAGIARENIYIVPGNHDTQLSDARSAVVHSARNKYNAYDGNIDDSYYYILNQSYNEYHQFYLNMFDSRPYSTDHFVITTDMINVLHINTSIMSDSSSSDIGNILIGLTSLDNAIATIDHSKPVIALAHHSFEWLRSDEREKVELHLKRANILFYLCGHYHEPRVETMNRMDHSKIILECLCSTNMDSDEKGLSTTMGFFTGNVDFQKTLGTISSHIWNKDHEKWCGDINYQAFPLSSYISDLSSAIPYSGEMALSEQLSNIKSEKETKKDQKLHSVKRIGAVDYIFKTLDFIEIQETIISERSMINNINSEVVYSNKNSDTNARKNVAESEYKQNKRRELFYSKKSSKPQHNRIITYEDSFASTVEDVFASTVERVCEDYPKNAIYLVIGAGTIGSEICRKILSYSPLTIVIVDSYEHNVYELYQELLIEHSDNVSIISRIASVCDGLEMSNIFNEFIPDFVFYCAAYKHVPLTEDSVRTTITVNIFGAQNVMELCKTHNVKKFIYLSTDHAAQPNNIMAKTKLFGELLTEYYSYTGGETIYSSVRFGNILGLKGSIIPLIKKQIECGGPVVLTHPDITRYFMTISEAATLVCDALHLAKNGESFVLDSGEPVSIGEIARVFIRLCGYEPGKDISIKYVGLRPGEKLYEELPLSEKNSMYLTPNQRIRKRAVKNYNFRHLISAFNDIAEALNSNDIATCKNLLNDIANCTI